MIDLRLRSVTGVWLRHAVALLRTWKVALTWLVFEPAVALVAIGFGIGQLVGEVEPGTSYAAFVTPGVVVGTAMFHAIFECAWAAFQRIRQHLLETMLTAPVTVGELALGEILWGTTRAAISAAAMTALGLGLGWLPLASVPGLVVAALLTGVLFSEIGLLFAAMAPSINVLSLVFTVVATPLYFFCGAFFPISVLPDWIEPVAWAMPLSPGVHLARAFTGAGLSHLAALAYLVVAPTALFPLVRRRLERRLLR